MSGNEELKVLYDQVINFLCGSEESKEIRITDKRHQNYALKIIADVSFKTCLPQVPAEFDNEGMMSLGLSEDTSIFNDLFQKRWQVAKDVLKEEGKNYNADHKPESPVLSDELDNLYFFILGMEERYIKTAERRLGEEERETLLEGLNDLKRKQCEDHFARDDFLWDVISRTAHSMLPVRKGWDEENSQYDFLSLKDENARSYYDTCRGVGISQDEHVTPEP